MIPAIEYVLRSERAKSLLSLPCSLMVRNNDAKLVITIQPAKKSKVVVKHWKIAECKKVNFIPSFDEFEIDYDEIFTNKLVVIPDWTILPFSEDPIPQPGKQYNDPPHSNIQENAYSESIRNFFNPPENKLKRELFLWETFIDIFKPECKIGNFGILYQNKQNCMSDEQNKVYTASKAVWKCWQLWKRYMLFSELAVAPEIIFYQSYKNSIKKAVHTATKENYRPYNFFVYRSNKKSFADKSSYSFVPDIFGGKTNENYE